MKKDEGREMMWEGKVAIEDERDDGLLGEGSNFYNGIRQSMPHRITRTRTSSFLYRT